LVLFTWAIQHLNVPYQKESKTQKQQIRNFLDEMLLKAFFMIGTIIAPELLLGKALGDLMSARESRDQMKTYAEKDKVEWSLTHAFYANMGGFVIQFSPGTRVPTQVDRLQGTTETTTTDHGHNALSLDSPELVIHESSDSIPKKEQVHESPVDIERGSPPRKRKVDISKPHKLISGEDCPCSDQKNDSEYKYMTIEDISVHFAKPWYLFGFNPFPIKFWNGRFLVDPGPFKEILKHPNEEADAIADTTNDRNASDILYELAHRPETDKNLFGDVQNGLSRLRGRYWALDARQLYKARELGIIESLSSVSEEAIQDQSKGDAVIKLTAMFQAFYLVLQLIVRRIEGLPSSLLEIMVVAFSACAFITYLLFFPKPQGVKVPRYIHAARYPTPEEIGIIAKPAPFDCMIGYRKRTYAMPNLTMHYWWGNKKSIFEFIADESSHGGLLLLMVGSVFGGMVFGAIHCAGVSLHFLVYCTYANPVTHEVVFRFPYTSRGDLLAGFQPMHNLWLGNMDTIFPPFLTIYTSCFRGLRYHKTLHCQEASETRTTTASASATKTDFVSDSNESAGIKRLWKVYYNGIISHLVFRNCVHPGTPLHDVRSHPTVVLPSPRSISDDKLAGFNSTWWIAVPFQATL
jgi:hypothetical protein